MNVRHRAERTRPVYTGDFDPAQTVRRPEGGFAAQGEIAGVHLVDVTLGMGGRLPAAEEAHRLLRGHVQIDHQIGEGQAQLAALEVKQPAEKALPLRLGQLAGLVDGVGGGVPVGEHQPAAPVVVPPHLFP